MSSPKPLEISTWDHSYRLTRGCHLKRDQRVPNLLLNGYPMTDSSGKVHRVIASQYGLLSCRQVNDHTETEERRQACPDNYKRVMMYAEVLVKKDPLEFVEISLEKRHDDIAAYFSWYANLARGTNIEPVSMLIKGEAGTGKTTIAKLWMDLLVKQGLIVERYSSDSDFCDNLVAAEEGQVKEVALVFMDEVFIKAENSEKDLKALMRIYNPDGTLKVTNPTRIKGRANVQLIVMTTNNEPELGTFNAGAINRRVDFDVTLRTDGKFQIPGYPRLYDLFDTFKFLGDKYVSKIKRAESIKNKMAALLDRC